MSAFQALLRFLGHFLTASCTRDEERQAGVILGLVQDFEKGSGGCGHILRGRVGQVRGFSFPAIHVQYLDAEERFRSKDRPGTHASLRQEADRQGLHGRQSFAAAGEYAEYFAG